MKTTARVIISSTFDGNHITYNDTEYPTNATEQIKELIDLKKIDLSEENKLVLVPHTLPHKDKEEYVNTNEEQQAYLGFTIIGVIKNQPDVEENIVNIKGKIIYENLTHEFVLVKIEREDSYEMIKLNGVLNDSVKESKGSAVEKYYEIKASILGRSLFIEDSASIKSARRYYNNVIKFPQNNYTNYDAA